MGDRLDEAMRSTAELLGSPPGVDPVAMEQARARAEARLFGSSAPPRIGRYEIEGTIGGGGMGVVYRARDPQLERLVALKVLHPLRNQDARSQQRMLLEARALAKLDHPNIVKVHDAILEQDQVVVVMELLAGQTLERWQQDAARTCEEVIAVYAQAGDGLAAAHDLGIVHRDFKPSNAILGPDHRVRVLDFGLAHLTSPPEPPFESGAARPLELTATGDVVGTLGYASPEQLADATITAASDQFSFCVALHLAIEGVSPFTGSNLVERRASIARGELVRATDGRRVPTWLRAAIARGLSTNPDARFPTMRDLVRELRRRRGWRRWRAPVLGTATIAASVVATAMMSRPGSDACDGGRALADAVWSSTARSRVGEAILAVRTPYSTEVHGPALGLLDRHASDWRSAHQLACRAHQRGETSELLLDRQMTCLSRRLDGLRAAVEVLASTDVHSLPYVMNVASEVPAAEPCLDLELVQADVAPPDSLAMRGPISAARERIASAEAQARAGRAELALGTLGAAREIADRIPYPPLRVEVALAEGRILLAQGDLDRASAVLTAARAGAFQAQMLPAAVEASARIIYAEGSKAPQLDRLQGELATLLPLSEGLRGDRFVRPLLLNNIGTVYLAAGRRAEAASYFELAKDEIRRHDDTDLELVNVDLNLAMITRDTPKREAIARNAWERLRDTLGEQHLATIDALTAYAMYVADPAVALKAIARAAASLERFHPTARSQSALAHARAAVLATDLGDRERAITLYRRAVASEEGVDDAEVVRRQQLCHGELALLRGEPLRASAALEPIYQKSSTSPNWWERADALRAAVGLGQAAMAQEDPQSAIRWLETAVRDLPSIVAMNEEVEYKRYLARARRALAELLVRRDPARAKTLEDEARSFYRAAGYP